MHCKSQLQVHTICYTGNTLSTLCKKITLLMWKWKDHCEGKETDKKKINKKKRKLQLHLHSLHWNTSKFQVSTWDYDTKIAQSKIKYFT